MSADSVPHARWVDAANTLRVYVEAAHPEGIYKTAVERLAAAGPECAFTYFSHPHHFAIETDTTNRPVYQMDLFS